MPQGTDLNAPGIPQGAYVGGCPSNAPPGAQCIPVQSFDPIAKNILALYPEAQNQNSRENNYTKQIVQPDHTYKFDVKIDYQLSAKNHLFGRESYQHRNQLQPGPTIFLGEGINSYPRDHNAVIGWDYVFATSATNQMRVRFNRFYTYDDGSDNGTQENNKLGFANGNIPGIPAGQGIANISPGEFSALGNPNWYTNAHRISNVLELDDTFTKVLGHHSLGFGEDLRRMEASLTNNNYPSSGAIGFVSDMTSACAGSGNGANCQSGSGSGYASFLLGIPDYENRGFILNAPNNYAMLWGIYGHDNFRVLKNLTINLALRWDVISNPVELHNHQSNFDPVTGLLDLAIPGNRHPNVNDYYGGLLPTVGFAYVANNRNNRQTVIRGGYGESQVTEPFGGFAGTLEENYPFSIK